MDEIIDGILNSSDLLQKYVLNGGVLMFVLIPCSLIMVAGVVQGMIALRRGWVMPRWILRQARQVSGPSARREFLSLLGRRGHPLARVIWLTLKDLDFPARRPARERVQAKLDDAIILVCDRMYDRLNLLSTIYTVGPLLGLVGTILGLMDTFHQYGQLDQPSVAMLAVGVQKALVTTLWGLSMAVPAFMAGQWFQGRIRGYERDLFPHLFWQVLDALYGPAAEAGEAAEDAPAAAPAPLPADAALGAAESQA